MGDVLVQKLLLFDGAASQFRTVKLRPRNPACQACGDSPSITADSLAGYDYTAFTGQAADDKGVAFRPALSMLRSPPCSFSARPTLFIRGNCAQVQCRSACSTCKLVEH